MLERVPKYTLRKLSVGLASVMIGSGILMNSPKVLADTINQNEGTSTAVQPSSQDKDNSKTSTQSGATQDENADSNAAVQKRSDNSVTETPATTGNKNKSENELELAKAPAGSTPALGDNHAPSGTPALGDNHASSGANGLDGVDSIVPDKPSDGGKSTQGNNNPMIYENNADSKDQWLKTGTGELAQYLKVTGKDGKEYVTAYNNPQSQLVINYNLIHPNTFELVTVLKNGNKNANPLLITFWSPDFALDTNRQNGEIQIDSQQGHNYKISYHYHTSGGSYPSYQESQNQGYKLADLDGVYLNRATIQADDTIRYIIPLKYIGDGSKKTQSPYYGRDYTTYKEIATRNISIEKLDPAQIETPAKPTTDKDTVTTGIYNNPQITTSDWIKMVHGDAIGYYTAKGKDGKTYVTGYAAPKGNSQSIFNVDQIDLNSLEYHLIYHNGDKEVGSGLWFSFADNKAIAIDTSRLGADGPQLKSQQGWSYKWGIHTGSDGGTYYNSWAEYLKAHNNVGDQASEISMTRVAIKPDDTIEFNIPVKYIGQLSARTPYLAFSPHINDYGNGFTQNWADLYFTTVKKDLSEVKRVVLLPTEFMGEKPGESDWKLVKEISKDMPNGWDAFKISNFRTYKGSFNMDSLPKGDLPSLVYGSAQYFIDLSKIQEIFANHGYTVKYANNNGKAQEMPFYAYSTIPLAKRVDDDRPVLNDPSIWVIQVQAVPAIILNKDQHYVADPNAKPWDTTSMIDEIYAADDAGQQRKTRDQLEKLPKTDVDISYEYQAPGVATAAAVDKVDLTKAGVYTVTYSHTYANGQVVKDSRKVYVDDAKQETKDITRTIIVHTPNESDQKVIQTATLTREVILDATTGEIKSAGKWSTAKWETYSAPEFKGYTPDKAQIDETTVNKDTQDTTVEISYTANTTPKQETKDITRTIIVHTPKGTDQKVIQKATLTREVILYVPTGEIKSLGEWSTAKWGTYSAPEFKGYTPDKAQIDETTVNKNTQDITVEISYTANTTQKQETKDITRTIIVHEPNGTDQKVIQKATLTREVILYAPTGEIKSLGEWSTAKWERYSAPEFEGYTPDKAQIDETTVNEDTQNTTVEISYTANETSEQPGHSKDNSNNDNNGGNSGVIVPINPSANNSNNSNNSNTAPTDNNTDTSKPTRTNRTDDISPKANVMNMTKRTTKSGTISPKAGALANTTAGPATSAKANMENGIAKNNSQNSQTLPQTGENESKVAFAVAGLLAAALGIFGIAINRKKEN
ncbi:mucin-binding protein [Lactobacillus crispatus]